MKRQIKDIELHYTIEGQEIIKVIVEGVPGRKKFFWDADDFLDQFECMYHRTHHNKHWEVRTDEEFMKEVLGFVAEGMVEEGEAYQIDYKKAVVDVYKDGEFVRGSCVKKMDLNKMFYLYWKGRRKYEKSYQEVSGLGYSPINLVNKGD